MKTFLAALLLALPAFAAAQTKSVDDPSWWWNLDSGIQCHGDDVHAAFQNMITADNKRLQQRNLFKSEMKTYHCAADEAKAALWREHCSGKTCENPKCAVLRKAMPPLPEIFGDVNKFEVTIQADYTACCTKFDAAKASARANYIKATTAPAAPPIDPQWANKSCAQLKTTRDVIVGLAAACVPTPSLCLLTATEIASINVSMKKLGCQ